MKNVPALEYELLQGFLQFYQDMWTVPRWMWSAGVSGGVLKTELWRAGSVPCVFLGWSYYTSWHVADKMWSLIREQALRRKNLKSWTELVSHLSPERFLVFECFMIKKKKSQILFMNIPFLNYLVHNLLHDLLLSPFVQMLLFSNKVRQCEKGLSVKIQKAKTGWIHFKRNEKI